MIVASGGDASFVVAGKKNLDVTKLLILDDDFGASLLEFASHFRRIAFDGEIEIAKSRARD